jgi:preprotein translocase subunit SecG
MELFITGLHIGLCFFLILVVLLQPGKGADFGAAMGGASQEVFGASGGVSLLSKITAVVAAMFMATSLSLAWFSNAPPGTDLTPEELMKGVDATGDPSDASVPLPGSGGDEAAPEAPAEPAADGAESAEPAAEGDEAAEPSTGAGESPAPAAAEPSNDGETAPSTE